MKKIAIVWSHIDTENKTVIEAFLKGSTLTWNQAYRLGCRCRRYDVKFTLVQKLQQ